MRDLYKVNMMQLYTFWKNLSIGLFLLVVMQVISTWISPMLSVFAAMASALILFVLIYRNKTSHHPTYMIVCYALMTAFILFALVCLVIYLLHVWGIAEFREEFLCFSHPFISILLLSPICLITLLFFFARRKQIHKYIDDKFGAVNDYFIKGKVGAILSYESRTHIKNLIYLFGVITCVDWLYYFKEFHNETDVNSRDLFVFFWFNILAFLVYEVYLFFHNYSIDETLRRNGELIFPHELHAMSPKTYYRYYVICGDKLFVNFDCKDAEYPDHTVLDTPFFISSPGDVLSEGEVKRMVEDAAGISGGEMRFYYGFQTPGLERHAVMRYFYFLDGTIDQYPRLGKEKGVWCDFNDIMTIYKRRPHALSSYLVADTARILTISRASKLFDENGYRRLGLKSYEPSFSIDEIRRMNMDLQSNKWIDISQFNEDVPFFRIRRWAKRVGGNNIFDTN